MKKGVIMFLLCGFPLILGCAPRVEMNKPVKVYTPYPYSDERWSPPSFEKEIKEIEDIVSSITEREKKEERGAVFRNLYNEKGGGGIWE